MADISTERVRKWTMENPEKRKEQNLKAALKYIEKNKDNPEFMERRRKHTRDSMRKAYHAMRDAMTEEELIEYRKKKAEEMRKYREKKKQQKLADEAAAKAAQEQQKAEE